MRALYAVCAEHLEEAIEDFLEAYEAAPDVHRLVDIEFSHWTAPPHCHYCPSPPVYLVV